MLKLECIVSDKFVVNQSGFEMNTGANCGQFLHLVSKYWKAICHMAR